MKESSAESNTSAEQTDKTIVVEKKVIQSRNKADANGELLVSEERKAQLTAESLNYPSWDLTARQLCDLELLLNGAFAPLKGFMNKQDYESVCISMRLTDGSLWPVPVVLDVTENFASVIKAGDSVALRDLEGKMIAVLHVEDVWAADKQAEAAAVYGHTTLEHPGVDTLMRKTNDYYLGGQVEGLCLPTHYDFITVRHTPAQLKDRFRQNGWKKIVAFQTRNPMHRAHFEITKEAAESIGGNLLIHPCIGPTKTGDVDPYTRVRCYKSLLQHYPSNTAALSVLPLAMRMAGPREAVLHAIIRKNYGCTHFIVGRDHAGPGCNSKGQPFYEPFAAQELLASCQKELEIEMVPFQTMVYIKEEQRYCSSDQVPQGVTVLKISGTELRQSLRKGEDIPEWFTFPEITEELRTALPPRSRQGFTVFFTGLPSSGKSTLANALRVKLMEIGGRKITLLDGDIVRKNLSSELTFSKEHRDLNIRRIGFVASEITKNGGIAICAPIAPYDNIRKEVRECIAAEGGFVLVHVDTPINVCEQRDVKGLYAKARAGIVKEFTGISDPYEEPHDAEIKIDTVACTPEEGAEIIVSYLIDREYLVAGDKTAMLRLLNGGKKGSAEVCVNE